MEAELKSVPTPDGRTAYDWVIEFLDSGDKVGQLIDERSKVEAGELGLHFALSRMRPDENGRISAIRLRDTLPFMPYQAEILPALEWLEKKKAVILVLEKNDKDPMAALMREGLQYIELRAPV